jgi:hypothetical protein
MKKFLSDRPWIWIVVAFVVMFASLGTVIIIAVRNEPPSVPLEVRQQHDDGP